MMLITDEYADDIIIACTNQNEIDFLINTFDIYKRASGQTLNMSKTEHIHFGNDHLHSPFRHIWPNTEFKHLGIPFTSTGISISGLEKKVDTILASSFLTSDFWRSHGRGAIIALNTFLMSHFIHLLSAAMLPVTSLQKIHSFCYNFCARHAVGRTAYDKNMPSHITRWSQPYSYCRSCLCSFW